MLRAVFSGLTRVGSGGEGVDEEEIGAGGELEEEKEVGRLVDPLLVDGKMGQCLGKAKGGK